jgi:hypothetical protein
VALGEAPPLLLKPLLELGGVAQEEAVEECPPICARRALEIARLESSGKLREVGRDDPGVEAQVGGAEEEVPA